MLSVLGALLLPFNAFAKVCAHELQASVFYYRRYRWRLFWLTIQQRKCPLAGMQVFVCRKKPQASLDRTA